MNVGERGYAFQHAGLDRAEHLRDDADALRVQWGVGQLLLIDGEGQVRFAGDEDSPQFLAASMHAAEPPAGVSFLGKASIRDVTVMCSF